MNKVKVFALMIIVAVLAGCSDPPSAKRALHGAGYSDISVGGYSWFSCGGEDTYATKFTAKGPSGVPVSGAVCSGLFFKNSTIRTE
jgi:hypothetical protein